MTLKTRDRTEDESFSIVWRIKKKTVLKFYWRDSYETTVNNPINFKNF